MKTAASPPAVPASLAPDKIDRALEDLDRIVSAGSDLERAAREIAELIRQTDGYQWVGLYCVDADLL